MEAWIYKKCISAEYRYKDKYTDYWLFKAIITMSYRVYNIWGDVKIHNNSKKVGGR